METEKDELPATAEYHDPYADGDPPQRVLYPGLIYQFFADAATAAGQPLPGVPWFKKTDPITSAIQKRETATITQAHPAPLFVPDDGGPNVSGPGLITAEYFPDYDKFAIFFTETGGTRHFLGEYYIFNACVVMIDILDAQDDGRKKYFMPHETPINARHRETGFRFGVLDWTRNGAAGQDGKQYPRSREQNKLKIITAILENPGANDYTISKLTGASPHTVKRYRPEAVNYRLIDPGDDQQDPET